MQRRSLQYSAGGEAGTMSYKLSRAGYIDFATDGAAAADDSAADAHAGEEGDEEEGDERERKAMRAE
jgi:hypothetical protein